MRNRRWLKFALIPVLLGTMMGTIAGCGKSEDSDVGEYTGPRRSKRDPNVWVDGNGKVVPAPADAQPIAPGVEKGKRGE